MALIYTGSLLTADEAEAALGKPPGTLDPSTNSPPEIMAIIKGVEGAIKNWTGRQFVEVAHGDLRVLRNLTDFLRLKDFPVLEFTRFEKVTEVDELGQVVAASLVEVVRSSYTVDAAMGFLETVRGWFPTGRVLLTYKTGFLEAAIQAGEHPDIATYKDLALRNIRRNWMNWRKNNLHVDDAGIVRGFTAQDWEQIESIKAVPRF